MLPVVALRQKLANLLAADTSSLAPAVNANKIALVNAPFTPNELQTLASLSYATFTGSTPLAGTTGTQGVGTDPVSRQQIITILAPAGGWRWVCTAAPGSPETIYGFALTDNTPSVLFAMALLASPVAIQSIGDEIDLGAVTITFVLQPMY